MLDHTQWFLAGMSIALSVQLSQPVVATVPVGKTVQTAQTNSSNAAQKLYEEAMELSEQGLSELSEQEFSDISEQRIPERRTPEALRGGIIKYEEALKLYRVVGDREKEAAILHRLSTIYSILTDAKKVFEYDDQLLNLYRAVGDRGGEAGTLSDIATIYSLMGEHEKALEHYSQSLPLYRAVGDRGGEANTLNQIGETYLALGETQKALEYYTQSLPLSRAVGDRMNEARILKNIGLAYYDLGEKQKGLEYYSQSLPLFRAEGDGAWEIGILEDLSLAYDDLGEKQKALEYYNQLLALFRAEGDRYGRYGRYGEARILTRIGLVYSDLGEKQKALEYYSQSLSLSRVVGNRDEEALTLNHIGLVYSDLGEKQKALEYYSQSLSLYRAAIERSKTSLTGEALTLNHIGGVYSDLGEKQKALEYYSQSLSLFRAISKRMAESISYFRFDSVPQSFPMRRVVSDRPEEAFTLNNIGGVYSDLKENQKALEYYNQSLSLFQTGGNRSGEAITLTNIGRVYDELGEKQKALEYYSQSLPLSRAVGNRSQEARTLYSMAYVKYAQGNFTEALTDIESSLKIIENLRTLIASPELRSSYFATVQDYYEFYIALLMQLHKINPKSGYDRKALEASERSRARSLLELLQESNANIREGISPNLLQQEKSLQQQLDAFEKQRIETISTPKLNQTKIAEIDKQYLALLEQYEQLQTKIRSTSPRYAALTQPQPLTLPEIQKQILDENTILLQYSLGKDRSYLWVVTSTGLTSYELPKRSDIETAAKNFIEVITSPVHRNILQKVAQASANLGQVILQPAAAQLSNKRLLIVPDGVLHYIPFTALTLPQTVGQSTNVSLIAEHEIITLPSASTLAILRQNYGERKPPNRTLAILADPVFSPEDERIKGKITQATIEKLEANNLGLNRSLRASNRQWPPERLPFTRQEAQTIFSLFPSASSRQIFDFDASRTTATDGNLANYQIVHFATHGIANSKNPELSGILMSMVNDKGNLVNGFLRLTDIFNLKLAANLVVLSACQSGMGQNVKGEGMVGLTRGFMYAGAQRVAVSLWNVDDEGTAMLMQKFYQKMLQQKLAPAAALRAAQMEMMQEEKWKSPYYWAAFTLQGEWK
ncbi:CHAT domain-containing protein [Microcoleus sp. Pol7_A1]|uniref:CHAT domain-containing tetratricopeptide repeat protein n=1 Tax=Microcoleus sp. Pol7_A1 TaxID=2818893 RepID=UPI002FCEE70B